MEKVAGDVISLLKKEFASRRAKNPYYSQRAFAALLKIPSGRLSELMLGRRQPSRNICLKIADALNFGPEETTRISLTAVQLKKQRTIGNKTALNPRQVDESYQLVDEEAFRLLADWEHFAILSLMDLKDFKADAYWIARRLGIDSYLANAAVGRLMSAGLIKSFKGKWIKTNSQIRSSDQVASKALRESHRQTLEQAAASLESVPVELRDISSVSLAIHPKRIKLAKKLIRNFRRQFAVLVEKGEKTEVYNLNIQFLPVTKVESK